MEAALIPTRTTAADPPVQHAAVERLLRAFLAGKAEKTVEAYRADLQDLARHLGVATIPEAARRLFSFGQGEANAVALEFRTSLEERGLSPASINRKMASLRSFSRMARLVGIVPWRIVTPNLRVRQYRDCRGPGKDAISAMFKKLDARKDPKGVRDRAIMRLLWDLGLRRCEIVRLDVADVDFDGEPPGLWVLGKGRREKQRLTLPEPTAEALRAWLAVREDHGQWLFHNFHHDRRRRHGRLASSAVYRLVVRLGKDLGIKVRTHGVRHSSITEAIKLATGQGFDLEEVRAFSRHSSVATLCLYRDAERDTQGALAGLVAKALS